MGNFDSRPAKPQSRASGSELTRLPELTPGRRRIRRGLKLLSGLLLWLFARVEVTGLEKFPPPGPALVVSNHLGDADVVLALYYLPEVVEAMAKIELYSLPVVGKIMEAFGVIWVHRGQPDRRALRAALEGFLQARKIGVAPEGRESLTGGLEEGVGGAAYLALKGQVQVVPITFTGTENAELFQNLRQLKRTPMTMTIGEPFVLTKAGDFRQDVKAGTRQIMVALSRQLPPQYRGVYAGQSELIPEDQKKNAGLENIDDNQQP